MEPLFHLLHNDHGEWQVLGALFADGWVWFRVQLAIWAYRIYGPFVRGE